MGNDDRLEISQYRTQLSFIDRIKSSTNPSERMDILYDNISPLVWVNQEAYYFEGKNPLFPLGGKRTAI